MEFVSIGRENTDKFMPAMGKEMSGRKDTLYIGSQKVDKKDKQWKSVKEFPEILEISFTEISHYSKETDKRDYNTYPCHIYFYSSQKK
jgi:hypothetical protein